MTAAMRDIPPVHRFLSDPRIAAFEALIGRENVKRGVCETLDAARASSSNGSPSFEALAATVLHCLEAMRCETLLPVINATGVLLHTNLGRAPIAPAAFEAMQQTVQRYSNIEYDVAEGTRGSRYARATALLRAVTGTPEALVVNNCAAAVLLVLDTFAKERQVIVARSQLIEIGGGFRLPDVMQRSGAQLVEVGTTNKTYLADYERALSPQTALLMRSHQSNFRLSGFQEEVDPKDLVALGRRTGIPVIEDLGSGAVVDLREYGLPHERTVQDALGDGIDLVAFSADKLLGGPQAGVICGSAPHVARLRSNPLLRALRVDKLTLSALGGTLQLYASPELRREIPFFAMLSQSLDDLRRRAERYRVAVTCDVVESFAYAGAGSLSEERIPSIAIALPQATHAEHLAAALRRNDPPVAPRIEGSRVLLDLRTIAPADDALVVAVLQNIVD